MHSFRTKQPSPPPPRSAIAVVLLVFLLRLAPFDLLLVCSTPLSETAAPPMAPRLGPPRLLPYIQLPRSGRRVVSVTDFGAQGNCFSEDTQALKDAWEFACSSPSSITLEIPAGNVYLINPIQFAGPCAAKVTVSIMGAVVAPRDPDVWDGLDPHKWLYFHGVNHLVVNGRGSINGMGYEWWARSCKRNATNANLKSLRQGPKGAFIFIYSHADMHQRLFTMIQAITFHRTKHLTVKDLTLMNSQQMHMAFTSCSHVRLSGLTVMAPADSPNTDGIHISESVSVLIEESTIRTGDDCISIVSNSSNVKIRKVVCGPGHGISIGSLGKSKSYVYVHDVQVDRCLITNTENGVRIKTWQGGSGYVQRINFQNIVMKNVSNPIIIDQYYCDSPHKCQNQTSAVKVDDISFIGIHGTSASEEAVRFSCSDSVPCERIFLKDIKLSLEYGGDAAAYCWKASGISSGTVYPPSCLSSADFHIIKPNISSNRMVYDIAR